MQMQQERDLTVLDPLYLDLDKFWPMIGERGYTEIVKEVVSKLESHYIEMTDNTVNIVLGRPPLYLLRKSLSYYIKEFDAILLACCLNDDIRRNMKAELATLAVRAILSPHKFDNDKFWGLVYSKKIKIDTLQHNYFLTTNYHYNGRDYLCFYPKLSETINAYQVIQDFKSVLLSCALNEEAKKEVNELYSTLKPNEGIPSGNNPPPPSEPKDILGRDIKGKSYSLYLNLLTGVVATLSGAVALIAAFYMLNAATFGIPGMVIAGAGVLSLADGARFFKRAWDQSRPMQQLSVPSSVS